MRVSQYYKLHKTQPHLDFVDVTLNTDVRVFVDPTCIRSLKSTWGQECASLLQRFFALILQCIKKGDDDRARWLMSSLNERNEFHIGFSRGRSKGHAWGDVSASWVWDALKGSKAATTGLLADLEDTVLVIDGVGKDMISDAVCNIIRGPLIRYTHDMCQYYGIPLETDVPSGPVWNPESGEWQDTLISLPLTTYGPLVLIPKVIVRHQITYDAGKYYTHSVLPEMQRDEIRWGTSLVHTLKNKTKKVYKNALRKKYGADKLAIVEQTVPRAHVLQKYRNEKRANPSPPLNHEDLAEVENTKKPDWADMETQLGALPTGDAHAKRYENLIENILSALFYPALVHPVKQDRLHNGRKIVDITYVNEARYGVFSWLAMHWPAAYVMVECKNYGSEIGNPELDQLSGRFGPTRGKIGLLICRSVKDRPRLDERCVDTLKDDRGLIVVLDDSDLKQLILDASGPNVDKPQEHPLLGERFRKLSKK